MHVVVLVTVQQKKVTKTWQSAYIFSHIAFLAFWLTWLYLLSGNMDWAFAGARGWSQQVRVQVTGRAGWGNLDCSCLHKIWPQINQTDSVSTGAVPKPLWAKITKIQQKKIVFWNSYKTGKRKPKMKNYLFLWLLPADSWKQMLGTGASTTVACAGISVKQVRRDRVLMLINRSLLKLCQFIPVKDIIPNVIIYSIFLFKV